MPVVQAAKRAAAAALVSLLTVAACSGEVVTSDSSGGSSTGDTASSSSGLPPPGTYVLDFSSCMLGPGGGIFIGANKDLVFTIDLQRPLRTYDCTTNPPDLRQAEIWGQSCPLTDAIAHNVPLQQQLASLGPGDAAHIKHIKLEIALAGLPPSFPPQDFCIAYRSGGAWHAGDAVVHQVYDGTTNMFDVDLPVNADGVDAVELFTKVASMAVARITYTTSE